MENTEDKAAVFKVDALQNRKVFTNIGERWGIPNDLFFGGVAFCIGISVGIVWWGGVLIGGVYFPTIYQIHKNDPRAAKSWYRGMTRKHSYWAAGEIEPLSVKYLPSRGGELKPIEREGKHNEVELDGFV